MIFFIFPRKNGLTFHANCLLLTCIYFFHFAHHIYEGEVIHFLRETTTVKIVLLPSEKGSTLKGKSLLPVRGSSFLLE